MKEKAIDLWRDFAPKHYMGQKQPGFGNSWRDKVKTRHGFKPENVSNRYTLTKKEPSYVPPQELDNLLGSRDPTNVDDEVLGVPVMQSLSSKHNAANSKMHLFQDLMA